MASKGRVGVGLPGKKQITRPLATREELCPETHFWTGVRHPCGQVVQTAKWCVGGRLWKSLASDYRSIGDKAELLPSASAYRACEGEEPNGLQRLGVSPGRGL